MLGLARVWGPVALAVLLLWGRALFSRARTVLLPPYGTLIAIPDRGLWLGADEGGHVVYVRLSGGRPGKVRVDAAQLAARAMEQAPHEVELWIGMPAARIREALGVPGWEVDRNGGALWMWGDLTKGLTVELESGAAHSISCVGLPFTAAGGVAWRSAAQSAAAAFAPEHEVNVESVNQRTVYYPQGSPYVVMPWFADAWDVAFLGVTFGWAWSLLRLRMGRYPQRAVVLMAIALALPAVYWAVVIGGVQRAEVGSIVRSVLWRTFGCSLGALVLWDWMRSRGHNVAPVSPVAVRTIVEVVVAGLVGASAARGASLLWHHRLPAGGPWIWRELGVTLVSCGGLVLVAFLTSQVALLRRSSGRAVLRLDSPRKGDSLRAASHATRSAARARGTRSPRGLRGDLLALILTRKGVDNGRPRGRRASWARPLLTGALAGLFVGWLAPLIALLLCGFAGVIAAGHGHAALASGLRVACAVAGGIAFAPWSVVAAVWTAPAWVTPRMEAVLMWVLPALVWGALGALLGAAWQLVRREAHERDTKG